MNIRNVILLSLGSLQLQSCFGGTDCSNTDFEMNEEEIDVTMSDATFSMSALNIDDPSAITCEELCYQVNGATALANFEVSDCSQNLDLQAIEAGIEEGSDSSTDVVGTVTCTGAGDYLCEGRRPIGFQSRDCEYFAKSAHLESSSVIAFHQLIEQLKKWNAPLEFIERCKTAREDEIRHAQQMIELAKRQNQKIPPLVVQEVEQDIYMAAMHNATEGCIFEAWAALEATLKSQFATTEELRHIYLRLAQDEISHAQLSWDLHRWFLSQLDNTQVRSVVQAQRQALLDLQHTIVARLEAMPACLGLQDVDAINNVFDAFAKQVAA